MGGNDAVLDIFFNSDRDRDICKKKRDVTFRLWSAHRKYTAEYNCLVGSVYDNISPTYCDISIINAITIEEKKKLCRTVATDQPS